MHVGREVNVLAHNVDRYVEGVGQVTVWEDLPPLSTL